MYFTWLILNWPEMEFKEFQPRFKSAKTWFKLSAGLNLETFVTILSETNQSRSLNLNRRSNSVNSANVFKLNQKCLPEFEMGCNYKM